MKIDIDQVPAEGLEVNQSYDPHSLKLETEEIKFLGPLMFSGGITRQDSNLRIKGGITTNIEFLCSRCITRFKKKVTKDFEVNYFLIKEKIVDITDDICQEIILEYPLKPLCRPDCKGLCMVCGQNLNEIECGCKRS